MKIITLNDPLPTAANATVVTVGNFDGVHRGHSHLLTRAAELARANDTVSIAVTFVPHTRSVVYPELSTMLLTTLEEKATLISKHNIDYLLCVDFDEKFRSLDQEEFVSKILVDKLRARDWVMGEGHHVGRNFDGAKKNLHFVCAKYHINMFAETLDTADGAAISSTRIRGLVRDGRIAEAVDMLGRPYLIEAERVSGIKVASTKLGFPTLNFKRPASGKVIPPAGVYAAEIEIDGHHGDEPCRDATEADRFCGGEVGASGTARFCNNGGVNINGKSLTLRGALYFGDCPTYAGRDVHFEFHALSYDDGVREPAIGETVRLWLREFIRHDAAFENEDALKERIGLDINLINKIFS